MPLLCIIAGQRSGTTALQSALGSSGDFENLREIFHTNPGSSPALFADFARGRDLNLQDLDGREAALQLAQDYIDHLLGFGQGKVPVIDVKFNSWRALQPMWSYPHEEPPFLTALKARGAAFLLIRRRDLVAQILSEWIARDTGVWHGMTEAQLKDGIQVDPSKAAEQARLIIQSERFFAGCLRGHDRKHLVAYEDLFDGDLIAQGVVDFCYAAFARSQRYPVRTPIQKNAGQKQAQVANYDAVARAVEQVASLLDRPEA